MLVAAIKYFLCMHACAAQNLNKKELSCPYGLWQANCDSALLSFSVALASTLSVRERKKSIERLEFVVKNCILCLARK